MEQKKVRIRHKLLYVRYTKPSFEDFTPLFDRPEKLELIRDIIERSKNLSFALAMRATCTATCKMSAVAVYLTVLQRCEEFIEVFKIRFILAIA